VSAKFVAHSGQHLVGKISGAARAEAFASQGLTVNSARKHGVKLELNIPWLSKTRAQTIHAQRLARDHASGALFSFAAESRRFKSNAALISATCVKAWGKLPRCSPEGPNSSAKRPR
jgi:hypothetical protein